MFLPLSLLLSIFVSYPKEKKIKKNNNNKKNFEKFWVWLGMLAAVP